VRSSIKEINRPHRTVKELKKESDRSRSLAIVGSSSHPFGLPSVGRQENREEKDNGYCSRRTAMAGIIDVETLCPASSNVLVVRVE
jgi:hypothetical protein